MANVLSATFTDRDDAQRAVDWLRSNGVPDDAITVVGRHGEGQAGHDTDEAARAASSGALTGAGIGAAVGALFGLAAFAIPGVGPFIAAGALANVLGAAGGAVASGAIVGATSGGLAGALARWGLSEAEARHYAGEVESGNIYVGVDLDRANLDRDTVLQAFRRYHARIGSETGTAYEEGTRPGLAGTMAGGSSPTTAQSLGADPTGTEMDRDRGYGQAGDGTTTVGSYGAPGVRTRELDDDADVMDDAVDRANSRSL